MSCHVVTLCSPCERPCPLVAPRTLNAVDGRLTLHTAPLHGVSHQITGPKTAPCRPGANDSTTFKRCVQIPPKSRRNLDCCHIGRYYEPHIIKGRPFMRRVPGNLSIRACGPRSFMKELERCDSSFAAPSRLFSGRRNCPVVLSTLSFWACGPRNRMKR